MANDALGAGEAPADADVRRATAGWWLIALVGVLSLVAGVVIIFKPGDSLATLAVIAGIFLLVDGILELVAALMHRTADRGLVAVIGAITAIVGVLLIRHPIEGVTLVALLIGIWLIAIGVIRLVAAFASEEGRGWGIFAGVVELIAGIVIVSSPNIGYTTLAILVGIAFIVNGLGLVALGWAMESARSKTST